MDDPRDFIGHRATLRYRPGQPPRAPRLPEEALPGARVGPHLLPWTATDSRFFRQAGVPSYGFSPFLIFATDTYRVDTVNERIALPGYVDGVRIYRDVVRRLVNDIP